MGIASIGNQNYSELLGSYRTSTSTKYASASNSVGVHNANVSNFTLHYSDEESGNNALTCVSFPDGGSASVYKADNFDDNNPVYRVKYWNADGEEQDVMINPTDVEPSKATYLEMLAYSTYCDEKGYTTNAYGNFLIAARGIDGSLSYNADNVNDKMNFKDMIKEFMQMQFNNNNLSGYLSYKKIYDYINK